MTIEDNTFVKASNYFRQLQGFWISWHLLRIFPKIDFFSKIDEICQILGKKLSIIEFYRWVLWTKVCTKTTISASVWYHEIILMKPEFPGQKKLYKFKITITDNFLVRGWDFSKFARLEITLKTNVFSMFENNQNSRTLKFTSEIESHVRGCKLENPLILN